MMLNIHKTKEVESWKKVLRTNFTDVEKLALFLEFDEKAKAILLNKPKFILNLPLRLAQKIKKNDLNDPILKQFLPTIEETKEDSEFQIDPVGDNACRTSSKLLHKYEGRILIVTTSACALHCRYCFRQHFEYDIQTKGFTKELEIIANDKTIHEVILSGGDPLSLSNDTLNEFIENLSQISHIKRLRFHTRFPIGIPERIDDEFLEIIKTSRMQVYFVLHINHANELDEEIFSKIQLLQQAGAIILNQAVLLKGVNDDAKTLIDLAETLVDRGILFYYLHQLDQVQGASHFEVSPDKGRALIDEISTKLPGYAVPKYVREIAGHKSKVLI